VALLWASPGLLFAALAVMGLIQGILGGIVNVSFEALIPKLFLKEDWAKTQAKVQGADQMGYLAGPILGALSSVAQLGTWALLGVGSFYFFSALLVRPFLVSSKANTFSDQGHSKLNSHWKDFKVGFELISSSHPLALLVFLTLLDNFLLGLHLSAQIPLTLGLFHRTEVALSSVLTITGILSLSLVVFLAPIEKKISAWGLWAVSYGVSYVGFLCVGLASTFWVYSLGIILVEISCAASIYSLRLIRAEMIPDQKLGRGLGALFFIQQLSLPLGAACVAISVNVYWLQKTTLICSVVLAVITAWIAPTLYRSKKNSE
jgi:hypothetical protein